MNTRILVIEDDKILLNNLSTLLEEEGYKVLIASRGKDGLIKAEKENPDLIICDIMMKGMDGFEVKEKLNSRNATFDIPLIFLTAKADISDLRKGMNLGAEDYLFKPYKADELLQIIKLRIEKKKKIIAKVVSSQSSEANDFQLITVNIGQKFKKIKYSSIKAFKASNQYSQIVLKSGKLILVRKSLTNWEENLPSNQFIRIHRSTMVNKNFINKIEKHINGLGKVFLNGDEEPYQVSRRYLTKIKDIS